MSHHESAARGPDARMVDRMLFFSDAVFAIALTLLVLELRPPHAEPGEEVALRANVGGLISHFAAFVISFALAGGWWLVHLNAARQLQHFDWPTAICNLVFLLWIALLPFAAAFFGVNFWSAASLAVYWVINAGAALSMTLLWLTMSRDRGRLIGGVTGRQRWGAALFTLGSGAACLAGAYFAFENQLWQSRFSWLLMAPFFVVAIIVLHAPKPKPPLAPA